MSGEGTPSAEAPLLNAAPETPADAPAVAPEGANNVEASPTDKAGEKPAADARPAEAPAPFAVKVPEGFKADEKAVAEFAGIVNGAKTKEEAAQAIFEMFARQQGAADKAAQTEIAQTVQGWRESLKTDKDFGGANFDANVKLANKALSKFGSAGLVKFLSESPLGNHPELVKAFSRIGKAMAEDTFAGSANGAQSANGEAALLKAMYPTMHQ